MNRQPLASPPVPSYNSRMRFVWTAGIVAVACALAASGPVHAASEPGVLRIGVPALPPTLDPATALEGAGPLLARQVFDTLVQYREGSSDVEAGLATRWQVSRDGLAWTFALRQGVTLHDGAPLTAAQVALSLERVLSASDRAPNPNAAARLLRGMPGVVREVRALDLRTLQVRLLQPYAPFLTVLAHPALSVAVRVTAADGTPTWLGTGPFKIVESGSGQLVLAGHASHWAGPPRTGRIEVLEERDEARGEGLVATRALDLWFAPRPPARPDAARSLGTWRVGYMALQSERDPMRAKRLRQAIAAALDPGAVASAVEPWAVPLRSLLPPTIWGHIENPLVWGQGIASARKLLQQAGPSTGVAASLLAATDTQGPEPERLGRVIQEALGAIGVSARLTLDTGEAVGRIAQRGEHDIVLQEGLIEGGDPHLFLYPLSTTEGTQKAPLATNLSFYRNPRLDDLLIRGSQLAFRAERARVYARAQALLGDEVPWIPLYVRLQWVVARPEVRGLRLHPSGAHRLSPVWVEQ